MDSHLTKQSTLLICEQ